MLTNDWDSVIEIYASGIATTHATFQRSAPSYSDWAASHPEAGRYVLCHAQPPHDIHAWIALSPISSRAVYAGVMELSLYVHPAQQGRGYGSCLMEHMIQLAPRLGGATPFCSKNGLKINHHQHTTCIPKTHNEA